MTRAVLVFCLAGMVCFTLALLRPDVMSNGIALEAEALNLRLFWESKGYARDVAMGWYPALPAWMVLPAYPLASPETLPLVLLAGGMMFVVLGQALCFAALSPLGWWDKAICLGSFVVAIGLVWLVGSVFMATLVCLGFLLVAGLIRLKERLDTAAIALLTAVFSILPLHSFSGLVLALAGAMVCSSYLLLGRYKSPHARVVMMLFVSSIVAGSLVVAYLQGFFGDSLREVIRSSVLDAASRPLPLRFTEAFGGWHRSVAFFGVVAATASGLILITTRSGALVIGAVLVGWIAVWSAPNLTAERDSVAALSEPRFGPDFPKGAIVLVETSAMPTRFAKRHELSRFAFPHSPDFRAALIGKIDANTFALRPTQIRLELRRDRLSTLLDRHPHRIVQKNDAWTLYQFTPSEEFTNVWNP